MEGHKGAPRTEGRFRAVDPSIFSGRLHPQNSPPSLGSRAPSFHSPWWQQPCNLKLSLSPLMRSSRFIDSLCRLWRPFTSISALITRLPLPALRRPSPFLYCPPPPEHQPPSLQFLLSCNVRVCGGCLLPLPSCETRPTGELLLRNAGNHRKKWPWDGVTENLG